MKHLKSFIFHAVIFCSVLMNNNVDLSTCFRHSNQKVIENRLEQISEEDSLFQVKIIDLGTNGDCTLITYQDTQILIDCGGTAQSEKAIMAEIEKAFKDYPEDKIFDYVIFSHGDSDHIINFAGDSFTPISPKISSSGLVKWMLNKGIKIDTFIDFDPNSDASNPLAKLDLYTQVKSDAKEGDEDPKEVKKTYASYSAARKYLKEKGYILNYFTSSQCLYEKRGVDLKDLTLWENNVKQPTDTFTFANSLGSLQILNNEFSYKSYRGTVENVEANSCDRNILSTCCLITFDEQKFLFTGDLPEFYNYNRVKGESNLVKKNKSIQEPVLFYKASHHGSNGSNSDYLLSYVRPQYIGVSCAINGQYQFPGDSAFKSLCLYTDKIYLTSKKIVDNEGKDKIVAFDGTITFSYSKKEKNYDEMLKVQCSEHKKAEYDNHSILSTDFFKISDSDKFKEKRFPVSTIELTSTQLGLTPNSCSYVKSGHIDILINDGIHDGRTNMAAIREINSNIDTLCNDHVLDYLVVSSQLFDDYSCLIGSNGLLTTSTYRLKKVKNLIFHPIQSNNSFSKFLKKINEIKASAQGVEIENIITVQDLSSASDYFLYFDDQQKNKSYGYLEILQRPYNKVSAEYDYLNSLGIHVNVSPKGASSLESFDYVNLGHCYDAEENENTLSSLKKINVISLPHYGYLPSSTNKASNYFYSKMVAARVYGILINVPFGSRNSENKNLYPSMYWYKSNSQSNVVLENMYATKFVNANQNTKLNLSLCQNAVVAMANIPFQIGGGGNLQYRANTNQNTNRPFTMFNTSDGIQSYSKYRDTFVKYEPGNYEFLKEFLR